MQHVTLSGRASIAVAALANLNRGANARPMCVPVLAERMEVSPSSVEQVLALLRRQGLVHSVRGPGGGYQLARSARDINLAEIIGAIERDPKAGASRIQDRWPALNRAIASCLAGVSLQDLLDDPPHESVHSPSSEAGHAQRRGISSRPVLEPVQLPRHANTVFALAEALK